MEVYVDNNATTKVDEDVLNEMLPYLKESFANPSSLYESGKQTRNAINNARTNVAKLLNAEDDEIIFTASATESNVTAIMSAARNSNGKKRIITSKMEHASILETMNYLETIGFDIVYLDVDDKGRISSEDLKNAINEDTFLIAIMYANNELGNIYPIKEFCQIAHEHNVLFHCDCTQAVGKIKVDVKDLGVDTVAFSGHKIHAPKGVAALYVKNGTPYTPLIFGHQENNRRGGTENVPYIVGLGKAASKIVENNYQDIEKVRELRDYFEEQIKSKIDGIHIYGDVEHRIPNTSNIAFQNADGNELAIILEANNINLSNGSACNTTEPKPSDVLVACHANLKEYFPIRVSFDGNNTKEQVDYFINKLVMNVNMLRRRK